jgi:prepilin-type processing-associated H-X9-DG protein
MAEQIQRTRSQQIDTREQAPPAQVVSAVPETISYATPRSLAPNGQATASLVLGIVATALATSSVVLPGITFLVALLISIIGVVLGTKGLRKTGDPTVGGRPLAVVGILLNSLVFILISALLLALPRRQSPQEVANRVKCASNMRQLGMAIYVYASATKSGRLPDDIGTVVADTAMVPSICLCPSVEREQKPDSGLTGAALAAWVNANTDYVYLGWGRRVSDDLETVILYELPRDHRGDGANVAFLDGHVEWIPAAKLTTLLASQARPTTHPARP